MKRHTSRKLTRRLKIQYWPSHSISQQSYFSCANRIHKRDLGGILNVYKTCVVSKMFRRVDIIYGGVVVCSNRQKKGLNDYVPTTLRQFSANNNQGLGETVHRGKIRGRRGPDFMEIDVLALQPRGPFPAGKISHGQRRYVGVWLLSFSVTLSTVFVFQLRVWLCAYMRTINLNSRCTCVDVDLERVARAVCPQYERRLAPPRLIAVELPLAFRYLVVLEIATIAVTSNVQSSPGKQLRPRRR